jgi:hypothetical protein
MTFSLRPRSVSMEPLMLASVSRRVVSWKDAAEMNESAESERFQDSYTQASAEAIGCNWRRTPRQKIDA